MGKQYSLRLINLFVGFFQHTLSNEEHNELDEWVCAGDDNLRVFESVVEVAAEFSLLEKNYSLFEDKNILEFKNIFRQMEKQIEQSITDKERRMLSEWASESEDHRRVFEAITIF